MRKFVMPAAAFAAAASFLAVDATAATVMERLTSARLASILTAAGAKNVQVAKPEAGVEVVSMDDGNGSDDFIMTDCNDAGCQAVQMTMFFNKDNRFNLAVINSYNAKSLNAQAALMPDGRVYLVDLFITVGGVTEENIKANLGVYLQAPELFSSHVLSQTTVSNQPAAPATVSAVKPAGVEAGQGAGSPKLRNLELMEFLATQPGRRGHDLK